MFTGIVETVGTVSDISALDTTESGGNGTSLTISNAAPILTDAHLGDSISVNGTCLTITSFTSSSFKLGVSPETLRRTNLGALVVSSPVNLERAVGAGVRFGGHFVQGHVDTIAEIAQKRPDGNAVTIRFKPREKEVLRYVVEKGYITIDGASLTVTAVDDQEGWWEVMLVAYTQEKIVTAKKEVGESVNVEVDMAGKYIEKQVKAVLESGGGGVLEAMVEKAVEKALAKRA